MWNSWPSLLVANLKLKQIIINVGGEYKRFGNILGPWRAKFARHLHPRSRQTRARPKLATRARLARVDHGPRIYCGILKIAVFKNGQCLQSLSIKWNKAHQTFSILSAHLCTVNKVNLALDRLIPPSPQNIFLNKGVIYPGRLLGFCTFKKFFPLRGILLNKGGYLPFFLFFDSVYTFKFLWKPLSVFWDRNLSKYLPYIYRLGYSLILTLTLTLFIQISKKIFLLLLFHVNIYYISVKLCEALLSQPQTSKSLTITCYFSYIFWLWGKRRI